MTLFSVSDVCTQIAVVSVNTCLLQSATKIAVNEKISLPVIRAPAE